MTDAEMEGTTPFVDMVRALIREELTAMGIKPKKPRKMPSYKISWDGRAFTGITSDDMEQWQAAFPGVAIPAEIRKAESWMASNGATKKNCGRFLHAWFSKAQHHQDAKVG